MQHGRLHILAGFQSRKPTIDFIVLQVKARGLVVLPVGQKLGAQMFTISAPSLRSGRNFAQQPLDVGFDGQTTRPCLGGQHFGDSDGYFYAKTVPRLGF